MTTTLDFEAPQVDIVIDQGSSIEAPFTLTQASVPLNMTGYNVRFQVRRTASSSNWIINATLANGKIAWVDQVNGQFKLVLPAADTAAILYSVSKGETESIDAVWDLEIIDPTLKVSKPCKGSFVMYREVTR